jgi:toxin-antitoxin system PIN domain toxin
VNLVDVNVLLYAVNTAVEHHASSRRWLDDALEDGGPVGFSWISLLAFLRLSTKPGLFPRPLAVDQAVRQMEDWLGHPASVMVEPTTRHGAVLAGLLRQVGTGGNIVSDAHLAALAVEHGAGVVTFDADFGRFPGVRWARPA